AGRPRPGRGSRRRPIVLRLDEQGVRAGVGDWDPAAPARRAAGLDAIGGQRLAEIRRGSRPELLRRLFDPVDEHVATVVAALSEDLAAGEQVDVTTVATVPAAQLSTADVVARADGTVAGLALDRKSGV